MLPFFPAEEERMHRRFLLPVLAAAGLLAATATPAWSTPAYEQHSVTLVAHDGITLAATVVEPTSPGPHPGLVLVPGYGTNDALYTAQATRFAEDGYVTLTYTPRGFWNSQGTIDVAGPDDVADASTAVDWLLANTDADAHRVGMAGISYGAGISLLAAAHDSRVRAVAALSPWADLGRSLLPNDTWNQQAIGLLLALGGLTGRPGPDLAAATTAFFHDDRSAVPVLSAKRSPAGQVDRLNANRPAVLLAAPWDDDMFQPTPLIDFFQRLNLPKQLRMVPGDHALPELSGLLGLPNETWDEAHDWLDHYLLGTPNGVDRQPAVQVRPTLGGPWQGYPSWAAMTTTTRREFLGAAAMSPQPSDAWREAITAGFDTVADGGIIEFTAAMQQIGIPHVAFIPAVARANGAVWQSSDGGQRLRGLPHVHLSVTCDAPSTTVIAYLYDVAPSGVGTLLAWQPDTLLDMTAPRDVDLTLSPVVHDVPAGDHLALVVDTVDPLYRDATRLGSTVGFTSSAADQSYVDLPVG
jgi:predicted acyl esterase